MRVVRRSLIARLLSAASGRWPIDLKSERHARVVSKTRLRHGRRRAYGTVEDAPTARSKTRLRHGRRRAYGTVEDAPTARSKMRLRHEGGHPVRFSTRACSSRDAALQHWRET